MKDLNFVGFKFRVERLKLFLIVNMLLISTDMPFVIVSKYRFIEGLGFLMFQDCALERRG